MLHLRICPHCQEETYSRKAYFCHRCGTELPAPSEVEETVQVEVEPKVKKERRGRRAPAVAVAVALCVALFSAAAVGVYYFYSQNQKSLVPQAEVPKNEVFVTDVQFGVENHPFSAKGLSEIVPANVDLYLESIDPETLLPSLVSTEDWAQAESFFSENLGLNASEATSFLEDEFAIIQESTGSAFLARVRDADFVEQKINEIEEYEGWQAKMVNGFLVVANSPDLIRAVEEAQKKLTLNLSLTPGFAEARKKLPQTGQIFYFRQTRPSGEKTDAPESGRPYGKKRLGFIPDEMKGEALVVSKKDGGMLITGL